MRRSLLQLACVAALGGFVLTAQAQQYGSPASPTPVKPASPPVAEPKTQADIDFRAALDKCNAGMESMRNECIRKAQVQYNQALPHGSAAASGGQASSAGPKASN